MVFNFGGSQTLRTQIEQGAPADIFASANTKEMDTLVAGGLIAKDTSKVFLTNQLIVILPKDNPAKISTLQDLSQPNVKLVLAAEDVPAGKYARHIDRQVMAGWREEPRRRALDREQGVMTSRVSLSSLVLGKP